jgi:hypothetical protein
VFAIEVEAVDDLGAVDAFTPGGRLIVQSAISQEKDDKKLTELERWQRSRSNAGSPEDERLQGDVLTVDCTSRPPVITVGNRDGEVRVELRGEAAADCGQVRPGQYLEADGEKLTEHHFRAGRIALE